MPVSRQVRSVGTMTDPKDGGPLFDFSGDLNLGLKNISDDSLKEELDLSLSSNFDGKLGYREFYDKDLGKY